MERYVETRQGKARVNWYRNGRLGVTYLESSDPNNSHHNVLREDQVAFKYGKIEPDEEQMDVREMEYDDLKTHVKMLREMREGD